jgi:hypothetical protein
MALGMVIEDSESPQSRRRPDAFPFPVVAHKPATHGADRCEHRVRPGRRIAAGGENPMIYGALILAFLLGMCATAFLESLVNRH